ncbi:unnamed protein product, partial [Symbiodinium necroappetens]
LAVRGQRQLPGATQGTLAREGEGRGLGQRRLGGIGLASEAPQPERLRAAEERAARAEQLLEAAVAREAVSASERLTLRKQLDDAEQLVSGLSQQLDSVQQEVAEQRQRCEALEKQLQEARAVPNASPGEGQDVALELMQRIAQLEAALGKDGNFDATAQVVR